ncbi:aminopeptidase P family protein [Pseudooceanicola batsensis]|uniref:aminopeptidase P family protein n=1 Tax=Pseudooceanicola batsensis TaxID=314255 RepID=UPI000682855E|nr:aminopeptidase P family protein [Pseudooceanicola batsensis]
MFQTFDSPSSPDQGPPRLARLREQMAAQGLDACIVPRADRYHGEYVAPHDDRLAWLTGFTGSAGFCVVTGDKAAVFVDGRYRVQVKAQVAADFTPVAWPETTHIDWLGRELPRGGVVGFDPWLHAMDEISRLERGLPGLTLRPVDHPVDRIWTDQPAPPAEPVFAHPLAFAGEPHEAKRRRLGAGLAERGEAAALITLSDSIAWLFNIRGGDIPRNPVPHGYAVLKADGSAVLVTDPAKCADLGDHLGPDVAVRPDADLAAVLSETGGPLRIDPQTAPMALAMMLDEAGIETRHGPDPCRLPKACKNEGELAGMRDAHMRDAVAMCRFLAWFQAADRTTLTEIDLVTRLEGFRRDTNMLREISFDTIAGAGPNGALPHYRVTTETNRALGEGDLIVLDSGGQYPDGTTDITRTLVVGEAGAEERRAFTLVLKGMIAISRLRFPRGVAGAHLDSLARYPLWLAGMDFDHGTGHGVGAYLCVHEGPQRLARSGEVPLQPGMILSNEPGYYREGAFGIRIENLIVCQVADPLPGGDARDMLSFETLTWVPMDRNLIDPDLLTAEERDWVDTYHATCRDKIGPLLPEDCGAWFAAATEKL